MSTNIPHSTTGTVPDMRMSWTEAPPSGIQKLTGVITQIKHEGGMVIGIISVTKGSPETHGNYLFPFVDSKSNPLPILTIGAKVGDVVEFCIERRMDKLERTDFGNNPDVVTLHAGSKLAWGVYPLVRATQDSVSSTLTVVNKTSH